MKRLTIVTHRRLDGDRSGSKTYLRRMMALAEEAGFSLEILLLPRATFSSRPWGTVSDTFSQLAKITWPGTIRIGARYVTLAPSVWARFVWRIVQEGLARLELGPAAWRMPWSNLGTVPPNRELDSVAAYIRGDAPDAVLVEYSSLGPLLRRMPASIGKALIVHDSFAARAELFAMRGETPDYPNPPRFEDEAGRMAGADCIFHASVNELSRFEPLVPGAQHIWFRPTAPVHNGRQQQRETPGLVYIGANQQGSRDAIAHFLADIWPSVLAEVPGVQVHIVGPVGHHLPSHLIGEGVKICGLVPDLADFAGPDLIGLLPTRLMSGISIKVGEYLGLGLPIVAYPAGIDGYGDTLDDLVQTAETPAAFAATVIALLKDNDARQRLSKAGLKAAGTLLQNPEVVAALEDLASVDRS